MKTLVLVHHAAADDSNPLVSDIERTLSPSGERAAVALAGQLAELGLNANVLLSSHAVSSRATADEIAAKLSLKTLIDRRLYDGGVIDFQEMVRSLDHGYDVAVLVGHNPSLSEFMRYLTDAERADIPLGSAVVIELAVNIWRHVVIGKGFFRTALIPPVEVVEEVKEETHPPPPRGWKDRLCHWLDLKSGDDEEEAENENKKA